MAATVRAQHCAYEEEEAYEEEKALGIISININQTNQTDIIPLVDNLEILGIFKDEDKEEGDSITDALSIML